ncbi:MAG: SH3 domain-containing protein, partial [Bacteroidota bacterium]
MKAYQLSILGLILLMGACKPSDPSTSPDASDSTALTPSKNLPKKSDVEPIRHWYRYAKVDRLRMRATPELDGEVVVTLREGDILEWTGNVSDHKETLDLRGKQVNAPWYEVVFVALGYKGWVFGGALTANFPIHLIQDYPKKKVGQGAYKAGPFNLFELADGRPLVLRDNITQTEEYFSMEFHSILEPEGWYQIKGFGYEYHFWLVLNPQNGKLTGTIGTLSASPERQWMAAYSGDMVAGFDFN